MVRSQTHIESRRLARIREIRASEKRFCHNLLIYGRYRAYRRVTRGNFEKGKRQNYLNPEHIRKIVDTYRYRREGDRYARRVPIKEIEENEYNLNISRYVSTAEPEPQIDLAATHAQLVEIEKEIREATAKHNEFLRELGLAPLPGQSAEKGE